MHSKLILFTLLIIVLAINSGESWRRLRRVFRKVRRTIRRVVRKVAKFGSKVWKFGKKIIKNWSTVKKLISCFKTVKKILTTYGILGDSPLEQLKILRDTDLQRYNEAMADIKNIVENEYGEEAEEMMNGFDTVMALDMSDLLDLSDELDQMGNDEILDDDDYSVLMNN